MLVLSAERFQPSHADSVFRYVLKAALFLSETAGFLR